MSLPKVKVGGVLIDPVSVRIRSGGVFIKPKSMWRRVSGAWVKLWNSLTVLVSAQATNSAGGLTTHTRNLSVDGAGIGDTYLWETISSTSLNPVELLSPTSPNTLARLRYPSGEPDNASVSASLTISGPNAGVYPFSFNLG